MTHSEALAIENERRLTGLEHITGDLKSRVSRIEEAQRAEAASNVERERVITAMRTTVGRLVKDFEAMSADHKRFIIGAALSFGGMVWALVRTKLGL